MNKIHVWFYIALAVLVALSANSISTIWAGKENKFSSPWLLAVVIISPFVFITFGLVTSKLGLAISSGTVDLLLTICSILVGLFLFNEWHNLSLYQYIGLGLAIGGMILMQFNK